MASTLPYSHTYDLQGLVHQHLPSYADLSPLGFSPPLFGLQASSFDTLVLTQLPLPQPLAFGHTKLKAGCLVRLSLPVFHSRSHRLSQPPWCLLPGQGCCCFLAAPCLLTRPLGPEALTLQSCYLHPLNSLALAPFSLLDFRFWLEGLHLGFSLLYCRVLPKHPHPWPLYYPYQPHPVLWFHTATIQIPPPPSGSLSVPAMLTL